MTPFWRGARKGYIMAHAVFLFGCVIGVIGYQAVKMYVRLWP